MRTVTVVHKENKDLSVSLVIKVQLVSLVMSERLVIPVLTVKTVPPENQELTEPRVKPEKTASLMSRENRVTRETLEPKVNSCSISCWLTTLHH